MSKFHDFSWFHLFYQPGLSGFVKSMPSRETALSCSSEQHLVSTCLKVRRWEPGMWSLRTSFSRPTVKHNKIMLYSCAPKCRLSTRHSLRVTAAQLRGPRRLITIRDCGRAGSQLSFSSFFHVFIGSFSTAAKKYSMALCEHRPISQCLSDPQVILRF